MDEKQWLAAARAQIAADARRRAQHRVEFSITRPTPNQDECDRAAEGEIVMLKQWDLSPIDPWAFDPTEPPGRPGKAP